MATGFVLVGLPPTRRTVGASGRAPYSHGRPRELATDERAAIRALAHTKSLRALAADFGVSHETVRAVLRGGGSESTVVEAEGAGGRRPPPLAPSVASRACRYGAGVPAPDVLAGRDAGVTAIR